MEVLQFEDFLDLFIDNDFNSFFIPTFHRTSDSVVDPHIIF